MSAPYYSDDLVSLYLGDGLADELAWTNADVLVTDPPYGISWSIDARLSPNRVHDGIVGDESTASRDTALDLWGRSRPALVFGSPLLAPPAGTRQTLVWRKPAGTGFVGAIAGWRRDWEAIYLVGAEWPNGGKLPRSAIVETHGSQVSYLLAGGHPHTKPVALMEVLISTCPPGVIADPFAGSGSTLIAARNLGRQAVGVEIEERYAEIIAARLAQGVLDFEGV